MLTNIGIPGLILIVVILLIIFGPKRLPEFGRAIGETMTQFKKSTRGLKSDDSEKQEEAQEVTENKKE